LLTVHVTISVGWIGVEASLLALGVAGLLGHGTSMLRSVYVSIGILGNTFLLPVSLGALVTGLLLSLGTHWGLVRYYWVFIKFVLTAILTVLSIFVVNDRMQEAAARVTALQVTASARPDPGSLRFFLVVACSVGLLVLLSTNTVANYKPWGRTSYGQARMQRAADKPRVNSRTGQ